MTDNDKLNAAFKELDYEDEAFSELEKQLQRKVAHGVTDGSQHDPIAELEQENRLLRARNERLEAEQHLQALHDENVRLGLYEPDHIPDAKKMVAQPEERKAGCTLCGHCAATGERITAQRQPLTDEVVMDIVVRQRARVAFDSARVGYPARVGDTARAAFDTARVGYRVARAIEAAHGIKE